MHFGLMVVAEKDDVESIIIIYKADRLVCQLRRGRDRQVGETELLAFDRDRIGDICASQPATGGSAQPVSPLQLAPERQAHSHAADIIAHARGDF